MSDFHQFGFTDLDEEVKKDLVQLNPKLDPLMMRYQGMGWYDILVQHAKGYAILPMGGENGYTAGDNEKKYIEVTDNHPFKSAGDLIQEIGGDSWQEIVAQQNFDHGMQQQVKTVRAAGVQREDQYSDESSREEESDDVEREEPENLESSSDEASGPLNLPDENYDHNEWNDFVDPMKEY